MSNGPANAIAIRSSSVFKDLFPQTGDALEVASGAGLHINYFAPHFPQLRFQPSDYDLKVFDNDQGANAMQRDNANVADPIEIDLIREETWPDPKDRLYDAIFVINIFQVAPLSIASGLAQLAARLLKNDGILAIYGPFKVDGSYTTRVQRGL